MTRTRFAIALTTVALLLTACHNYQLDAGGVYYLTSRECADGTSHIKLNHTLAGAYMYGTSGAFGADSSGCAAYVGWPAGRSKVAVDLYKQDAGVCLPGHGFADNPDGNAFATSEVDIVYICGAGNYYAGASNYVNLLYSGVVIHFTAVGDAWS